MSTEKKIQIGDKVICQRNLRDDKRFKHELIGLVTHKYQNSALVIIASNREEDDMAMLEAKGKTVIPYREMKKIEHHGFTNT